MIRHRHAVITVIIFFLNSRRLARWLLWRQNSCPAAAMRATCYNTEYIIRFEVSIDTVE